MIARGSRGCGGLFTYPVDLGKFQERGKSVGGPGGGRWRSLLRAEAVEDCLALDVGMLLVGGVLTWTNVRGEPVASMGCELDGRELETPSVILRYTIRTGETVAYRVGLLTTRPHFGGLRRWFGCPRCSRRVGKLYLPPGKQYLGCRVCFGLTYRSCQESHKVDLLAKARNRLKMVPVG